ncbi:ABC transporter permease subunit [Nakamurella antarctica]|uniref:Maltose/maltodextrin transport system permease protein n=2 Tax=Nakamurella antarctica TaxID=1902245 RepID=A0A3G8ZPY3_9ACTN|nr:ABC transporter permease subunit [Nakamurella antarctica]
MLLGVVAAIAVFSMLPLIDRRNWLGVILVVLTTAALFYIYLTPKLIPAKYLVVGTLFLAIFQVLPIVYTITTAFTNFGDGHRGTKEDAIVSIRSTSVKEVEGGATYTLSIGVSGDENTGDIAFLLADKDGNPFVGTAKGVAPLDKSAVTQSPSGKILAASDYTVLNLGKAASRQADITALVVPTDNGAIIAKGVSSAFEGGATRKYDAATDTITDSISGQTWAADDTDGYFKDAKGAFLPQGWQVNVGLKNFVDVFTNPSIAKYFLQVILWNFAFALLVMASTFALGLGVAMVMNSDKLRGRKIYRSILILPYAMPGFAMLLLWRDMFNTDYGLINKLFGTDIDWFGNPWAARAAVLIVQLWMGYPYMFLVCTGALQSIPSDLVEAAGVDGAKPFYAFRTITFPLLLVAVAPLLIATFAFNFNNFGAIYLVSGGGPFPADNPTVGATDLLISYTYRLAFGGQGAQYGLAAAISILIFIIVAAVSFIGFKRTKALEEIN